MVARHLRLAPEPHSELPEGAAPSFEQLYEQFSAYVAGTAINILGRDDEVEDIVQDVFLACARRTQPLPSSLDAKRWLATVTVRAAMDRLNRRRRWRWVVPLEPRHFHVSSVDFSPEERALLSQLYGALDRLPAEKRAAWVLRHLQGERLDQVAAACDCSLATAKRWIAEASVVTREVLQ